MVYSTHVMVSKHLMQLIAVVALEGELLKSSNIRGDRFVRISRATVEMETLDDRGWLRVVIVLE